MNSDQIPFYSDHLCNGQIFFGIRLKMISSWSESESEMIWVKFQPKSILPYFHQNYSILSYLKKFRIGNPSPGARWLLLTRSGPQGLAAQATSPTGEILAKCHLAVPSPVVPCPVRPFLSWPPPPPPKPQLRRAAACAAHAHAPVSGHSQAPDSGSPYAYACTLHQPASLAATFSKLRLRLLCDCMRHFLS
jgi:hypothetical protein